MNDRVGPNGEKILHVEEIQSDLHQTGKKGAYEGTPQAAEMKALEAEENRLNDLGNRLPEGDLQHAEIDRRLGEINDLLDREGSGRSIVPNMPFKDNWHELAMKRVIRYAAENGYDRITLNPGEQINKVLGSDVKSLGGQKKFYGSANDIGRTEKINAEVERLMSGQASESPYLREQLQHPVSEAFKEPPTLPQWMENYGKQYGVKVEPHEYPGLAIGSEVTNAQNIQASLNHLLESPVKDENTLRLIANYEERLRDLKSRSPALKTTSIAPNAKMREQALFKGQSLMSLAPLLAGAGGGPLLAALMGQGERS